MSTPTDPAVEATPATEAPAAPLAVKDAAEPPRRDRTRVLLVLALAAVLAFGAWYLFWHRPAEMRKIAYLHAARGVEESDRGNVSGAIREFQYATRLDPGNPYAWRLLGNAQHRQNANEGLPALARAAKLNPNDPMAQQDYGAALLDQGKVDEARAALTLAVQLAPTEADAHKNLARAYLQRVTGPADLEHAIAELKTVLQLQPGDVDARFRLARALFQSDHLEDARREFQQCLEFLAAGARSSSQRMDGRTRDSALWFGFVKGAHNYLAQIASRGGHPEEAQRHRAIFDQMQRYVEETAPHFSVLKANSQDKQALDRLAVVFSHFGFPPEGPDGAAAARRWIP